MRLDVDEFFRRFLLHTLPKGFFKVRYYGIFTNRYRKENIEKSKQLIAEEKHIKQQEEIEDGVLVYKKQETFWNEILLKIENFKKPNCPACKKGLLRFAGIVPNGRECPG